MTTPTLVKQLKELGVTEKTAKYALERYNNDVTRAADYVFSGAAGKDEVSNNKDHDSPPTNLHTIQEASSPTSIPPAPDPPAANPPSTGPSAWNRISSLPSRLRGRSVDKNEEPALLTSSLSRSSTLSDNDGSLANEQASDIILGALDRDRGRPSRSNFLGLKRTTSPSTPPRSPETTKNPGPPTVIQPSKPIGSSSKGSSKGRAPSPFFRARRSREKARARDTSPEVGPLQDTTADSDGESVVGSRKFRPQASAYDDGDESGTEVESDIESEMGDDDSLAEDEEIFFDEETEKNTEANAVFLEGDGGGLSVGVDEDRAVLDTFGEEIEQDPHGEGPNVVVAPQSMFGRSSFAPKRRKSVRSGIELVTSRPSFARDRCTITLTHGDPDGALERSGKRMRRYVVLSDLSDESRYAVEWAVGTVARDGDEIFLISVKEDESKVDPKSWSDSDKSQKLKTQRERQTTALLLTKQVTSLLQRTQLNITVTCQFLHAKNARHMLLDLIDFLEPTMAIVGSRGLGQLKGILLGSTSHYLVQKSSVPVMVARRRLQRPLRKTDPSELRHSPRVSLASASIEKTASSKQEDEVMDVAETEAKEMARGGGDKQESIPE